MSSPKRISGNEDQRFIPRDDSKAARRWWYRSTEKKPVHRKELSEEERERRLKIVEDLKNGKLRKLG